MPNKKDDKNYHTQKKRLEKERLKLEKHLNELYQEEKTILSASANQDIQDKIKILQREISDQTCEMINMDVQYDREIFRRKHCPIPSNKCPICPLRPASKPALPQPTT